MALRYSCSVLIFLDMILFLALALLYQKAALITQGLLLLQFVKLEWLVLQIRKQKAAVGVLFSSAFLMHTVTLLVGYFHDKHVCGKVRLKGRKMSAQQRIGRPDLAQKFNKRYYWLRHERSLQVSRRRWKTKTISTARPVLTTDVLPSTQKNTESILGHGLILFLVNPIVVSVIWQNLWEPFLYVCILERTVFIMGLLCLAWMWPFIFLSPDS